jgi:hypothetical protein
MCTSTKYTNIHLQPFSLSLDHVQLVHYHIYLNLSTITFNLSTLSTFYTMSSGGGTKDDSDNSPTKRTCVDTSGTVTLILGDGKLQLDRSLAVKSSLINTAMGQGAVGDVDGDDGSGDEAENEVIEVPLPTVDTKTMQTMIDFLEHHATNPYTQVLKPLPSKNMGDLVKDKFDLALVTKPEEEDIRAFTHRMSHLLSVAEYIGIEPLIKLCMLPFAVRLKGVQQAQALENFGIDPATPFTKEAEEQILRDYPWLQTDM